MGAGMSDLREVVRRGTLRRMQRALAAVDARLEGLRAERDRLASSIAEVEGGPPGRREDARAEALYRPDPVETTPAYREAWTRGLPNWPPEETAVLATVTLDADGRLVVSAPGTPTTRIIALREKLAGAAGQRVAELVEEALQAKDREGGFSAQN